MSLSAPRATESPVKKFFRAKATDGGSITWYDKAEKKEVPVDLPFRFTVLDVLSTVRGYDDASQSGIWSNEVRDLRSDVLRVRSKGGAVGEGLYSSIRDSIRAKGAKFANSVYLAFKDGDELAIGNIVFVGSSLSSWIEFTNGRRLDSDPGVAITGFTEERKGATKYFAPVFERLEVSGDTLSKASDLDVQLQAYLNESLQNRAEAIEAEAKFEEPVQQSFGGFGSSATLTPAAPF
ncbi:hypothetical protein [Mycobacterium sp. CnD-18-1]|uniref:hypothetical protein n=1 Tax=Mycobacterium sp. CnD-18-1 TaxID=2917744 RepID=UPI001EF3B59B|nr:hypothetical protein [Mycobacterium sp. CnD-18-1]MCG7607156.1 hypothetical protein [Mycobacterium sp. CnD-18-1]